jgi:hypothetical protein
VSSFLFGPSITIEQDSIPGVVPDPIRDTKRQQQYTKEKKLCTVGT